VINKKTTGERVFEVFNYSFLFLTTLLCIFPILHVLALSFSSSSSATAGKVTIFPVDFNIMSYKYALQKPEFLLSFWVSIKRVMLGAGLQMTLTVLAAYPLSKEKEVFRPRSSYSWFFFITMLFSGGLIPLYMVAVSTGIIDNIWGLVLPGAVPVFNVIVLMNFFRQLPKDISEAAYIDGANHWTVLWRIFVPLSTPSLATLLLFCFVGHWNAWFDGLILMNNPDKYPLQTYLQTVVITTSSEVLVHATKEELEMLNTISDRTTKASQIFIAAFPILCAYPFLQKHFVKGIVLGSVKG
jgi:putative aldouronate transport system permease protein